MGNLSQNKVKRVGDVSKSVIESWGSILTPALKSVISQAIIRQIQCTEMISEQKESADYEEISDMHKPWKSRAEVFMIVSIIVSSHLLSCEIKIW